MKCLVLGGNGFIGSHLVDKLLLEGNQVRVFDLMAENFRSPRAEVDYVSGDFSDGDALSASLSDIEIVFHLACSSLPGPSNENPFVDVQANLLDTISLLDQCVSCGVKKVVYTSSGGTVYGIPENLPVSESCPTDPLCSYGIVKLTTEKYLALYQHLHGLEYAILRPSNPYGCRQNPLSGQGVISVFLGKIARNEPLQIWGRDDIVRDYIYIEDLVEGIYLAALNPMKGRIYNLGSGVGKSLGEIIDIIDLVTNSNPEIEFFPSRACDIPGIFLDISRAKRELGWTPQVSLTEGIRATWEFVSSL